MAEKGCKSWTPMPKVTLRVIPRRRNNAIPKGVDTPFQMALLRLSKRRYTPFQMALVRLLKRR